MTPESAEALSIAARKAAWRQEFRRRLGLVTPVERAGAGAGALAVLRGRPEWRSARAVLAFAPRGDEIDLTPVLREVLATGGLLALPRFDPVAGGYGAARVTDWDRDLRPARFGVLEPSPVCPQVPINQLDFALVPGLGFDRAGRRLGRGKAYYDQLLAVFSGTVCGVALDGQVVDELPVEPHDRVMDCILTPTRWLAMARRTADS